VACRFEATFNQLFECFQLHFCFYYGTKEGDHESEELINITKAQGYECKTIAFNSGEQDLFRGSGDPRELLPIGRSYWLVLTS